MQPALSFGSYNILSTESEYTFFLDQIINSINELYAWTE